MFCGVCFSSILESSLVLLDLHERKFFKGGELQECSPHSVVDCVLLVANMANIVVCGHDLSMILATFAANKRTQSTTESGLHSYRSSGCVSVLATTISDECLIQSVELPMIHHDPNTPRETCPP